MKKTYQIKEALKNNNIEVLKNLINEEIEAEESKKYFCGFELSQEEIEKNRISYYTFARCFDAVLCNNITEIDPYIWDNVETGNFEYYEIEGDYYDPSEKEEKQEELKDQEAETIEAIDELQGKDNLTEAEAERLEGLGDELQAIQERIEAFEEAEPIQKDIYQYFLIGTSNLYLFEEAGELVLYSDKLDCYIWCVDHWGTPWAGVSTSIKIDNNKD